MATEKKLKDPAEAALSAIEQALNLDALTPNGTDGRAEPQKAAPAPGEPRKKSPVPLILAGVVLLVVLAAIIVLVLVTRK